MIVKNYECILNFFVESKNMGEVLKQLKELEGVSNIKKIDVSFIETSREEIKNYCKNNNICYSYSFNECIHLNLVLEINSEKLKEECCVNNIEFDDTIKFLDCVKSDEKEEELLEFITGERYERFIFTAISNIEEIIEKFEEV